MQPLTRMRQIFAKHLEKGTKPPIRRLQEITECLIDGLVEDQESVRSVRPRSSELRVTMLTTCVGNHQLHQDRLRSYFDRSFDALHRQSYDSSTLPQECYDSASIILHFAPHADSSLQPEEQQICEYLLKIFRSAVVGLPKTASKLSKFAKDLQQALIPMINKPPPVPAVCTFLSRP